MIREEPCFQVEPIFLCVSKIKANVVVLYWFWKPRSWHDNWRENRRDEENKKELQERKRDNHEKKDDTTIAILLRSVDFDGSYVSQKSRALCVCRSTGWGGYGKSARPSTTGCQNTILRSEFLSKIVT